MSSLLRCGQALLFHPSRRWAVGQLAVFFVLSSAAATFADIISVSGNVQEISPPASVKKGDLTSNKTDRIFREQPGLVLSADVTVDFTAPGTYLKFADLPPTSPIIPAGTAVDSYFFHADPVTAGTNFVGSITFSTDILGVILRSNLLDDSDGLLGFPTTAYPTALNFRGVDLQSTDATIILSGDRRTVSFDITTQTVVDQFRVITAASTAQVVPEPSTLALLGLGFAVLVVYQRRSRSRIRLPSRPVGRCVLDQK